MAAQSELASLVETESRLDGQLASARHAADVAREAARARALAAEHALDDRLAHERTSIAATIAAETTAREAAIEGTAAAAITRYDAVRDEALANLARRLAERLVAMEDT